MLRTRLQLSVETILPEPSMIGMEQVVLSAEQRTGPDSAVRSAIIMARWSSRRSIETVRVPVATRTERLPKPLTK